MELNQRKIELQTKIKDLKKKKNALTKALSNKAESLPVEVDEPNVELPTEFDVKVGSIPNAETRKSELSLEITKPGWIIKGVIMYNEALFSESNGTFV